jgi:hypothetical protein
MADQLSEFIPLSERAVRRDGTISLKLIQPGWGSSGYYPREVLERDIPKVFPKGTHMMWNHATPTEEMERPEGDLRDLAAVTVSDPIWLEGGPHGPGMYAEARPFAGYANAIDEIGEHIGVSIRGMGRHTTGEAEGKSGRIIQEIAAGKSVDFVTVPGAGGAIVSIFESAPNAGKLSDPTQPNDIDEFLSEAGRVLSKANETKLKAALEQLTAVLSLLNSEETSEAARKLAEAANVGEWLESRLHLALTQIADDMFGNGRLNREERKSLSFAIGQALDAYHQAIMNEAPQLFEREPWRDAPALDEVSEAGDDVRAQTDMEDAMSEQELKEARDALKAVEEAKTTAEAELAKAREQLLFREAGDFVSSQLAEAELPDVTKARLQKALAANPPVKEGALDKDAFKTRVETAVTEAQTEIAALLGKDGRVTGNGQNADGSIGGEQLPDLAESRKRADEALASMGYATVQEA